MDLIDRQAAIEALNKLDVSDGVGISSVACDLQEEAIRSIENLPSADVEEVKHGVWEWDFADNGWADWTCSECGWKLNTDVHVKIGYRYCPNCGAKMDRGVR